MVEFQMKSQSNSNVLAQKSAEVLLASIEIGNKINCSYREESFFLLLINAWELLLKARILQENNDELSSIYEKNSNGKVNNVSGTEIPRTISFSKAINKVSVPQNVKSNLQGILAIRNTVAHLGILTKHCDLELFKFGSASIINFCHLYKKWFSKTISVPYFLPVAFSGDAEVIALGTKNIKQKNLLQHLSSLSESADGSDNVHYVSVKYHVHLSPEFTGGGTIGVTNDPNAPKLSISDDKFLERYSSTYSELVLRCRTEIPNFKQNSQFNKFMAEIKKDAKCAHERKLNPKQKESSGQCFYNVEESMKKLKQAYKLK